MAYIILLGIAHLVVAIAMTSSYRFYGPSERVLDVIPHCGNFRLQNAWLEIKTDVSVLAKAVCLSNQKVAFKTNNSFHYYLAIFYSGETAGRCVFVKNSAGRYTVQIVISWGDRESEVDAIKKIYQVTCTPDNTEMSRKGFVEPITEDIKANNSMKSTSTVSVRLLHVLDGELLSGNVRIGQEVLLQIQSNGEGGESGIRPVACDLVGLNCSEKLSILKAGCGDGLVFDKDQGFTSNGLISVSPIFKMRSFSKDPAVSFQCKFILCDISCNGDSCSVNNKRRNDRQIFQSSSDPIKVILTADLGIPLSEFIINTNQNSGYLTTSESSPVDHACTDCLNPREKDDVVNLDTKKTTSGGLPPAEILPNTNTLKREYQRWPRLFNNYALMIQSAWPLGLGVLMAVGMLSTLVVALVLVCRDRRSKTGTETDGGGEYDSLLE